MTSSSIHIISFDVPYPPDYGGAIDVFYKLKALHAEGIKITLHCFEYGKGEKKELERYCSRVYYYKRKTGIHLLFHPLPYIVVTRASDELAINLLKDKSPILFEGLHCCYSLNDKRLEGRRKVVRMHNIEHTYYSNLAKAEKSFFKRKYFESEAKKLQKFESVLKNTDAIAAISPADTKELTNRYKRAENVMAFHPHDKTDIKTGTGNFALYHGSLAVGENNKAALYLVNEVATDPSVPLVIAGNGASSELKESVKQKKHITLKENISTREIYTLIQNAQVNILPTFQATGIKLKLLSALYTGRHCLVNVPMVENTGLESLCAVARSADEMKNELLRLMKTLFTTEEILRREKLLGDTFSNRENVKKLIRLLNI